MNQTRPGFLAALPGRSRLAAAVLAGVVAGTLATALQMLMWWLDATPVLETLLRDARLTAAIVMGRSALASPPAWRWDILLIATLIHFGLCVAYAAIAAPWVMRLGAMPALLAGAVYGLAIYGVNLHGFTAVFPWFRVSRGWVSLVVHVVFGITLAGACRFLASPGARGWAPPGN